MLSISVPSALNRTSPSARIFALPRSSLHPPLHVERPPESWIDQLDCSRLLLAECVALASNSDRAGVGGTGGASGTGGRATAGAAGLTAAVGLMGDVMASTGAVALTTEVGPTAAVALTAPVSLTDALADVTGKAGTAFTAGTPGSSSGRAAPNAAVTTIVVMAAHTTAARPTAPRDRRASRMASSRPSSCEGR